jgi:hypothetical protein
MTDPDFHACAVAALGPLQRRRRRGRLAQVTEVGDPGAKPKQPNR